MTRRALPETDDADPGTDLWVLSDAVLHVGPSLDPGPHAGSVPCLAVGLEEGLRVRCDGMDDLRGRSVLVSPGVRHQVLSGSRIAFLYLDPLGGRVESCREAFGTPAPVASGHREEVAIVRHLRSGGGPEELLDLVAPDVRPAADVRVADVLATLRAEPDTSARSLARSVGLSESHLLALFSRHAGMTLRRYRGWVRMGRVARSVAAGHDLTRAAADAGFASPSHLSDAFRALFGLTASAVLAQTPRIHVPQERSATS